MRIITCIGDQIRSSTFFFIVSDIRITNNFMSFSAVSHVVYSLTVAFCTIS